MDPADPFTYVLPTAMHSLVERHAIPPNSAAGVVNWSLSENTDGSAAAAAPPSTPTASAIRERQQVRAMRRM